MRRTSGSLTTSTTRQGKIPPQNRKWLVSRKVLDTKLPEPKIQQTKKIQLSLNTKQNQNMKVGSKLYYCCNQSSHEFEPTFIT